jgi:hypothetical protein
MALSEVDRLTRPRLIPGAPDSVYEPQHQEDTRGQRFCKRASKLLGKAKGHVETATVRILNVTAPALSQVRDHLLTVAAFVSADWAAFLWNEKSGLITAAVLLIAFELKVSRT